MSVAASKKYLSTRGASSVSKGETSQFILKSPRNGLPKYLESSGMPPVSHWTLSPSLNTKATMRCPSCAGSDDAGVLTRISTGSFDMAERLTHQSDATPWPALRLKSEIHVNSLGPQPKMVAPGPNALATRRRKVESKP